MDIRKATQFGSHTIIAALSGALLFGAGASLGQSPQDAAELPSGAIVIVEKACPRGWQQVAQGQVIVGAGPNVSASGGNPKLLEEKGVRIAAANIPTLTATARIQATANIQTSYMPISSGANGSFFANNLYANGVDVNLYGYTTYHGRIYDTLGQANIDATAPISLGNSQPAVLDTVMPYIALPMCKKP
jgi:hypothetical protein